MELTQLILRAQQALDRGEVHVVEAACRHALTTYPACLAAHRLLGEACLEQGRIEEAEERFGLALVLNPLDPVAHFGLGVAAEERGDLAAAHAYHLRAWELNPDLDQLRDEVVRLHAALHGAGQLARTRAGLAGLFARAGQLHRAAAEWRAVVAAEPENVPARTALIEVLWRQNDDAAALALCREVLASAPETARVLAIQADFEQRRALPTLSTTVATYRSLDPTGEILTALQAVKPQVNLGWLMPEVAMVPPFDFEAVAGVALPIPSVAALAPVEAAVALVAAGETPSAVGPAPDLWDSLVRDLGSNGDGAAAGQDLAPFSWPVDGAGSAAPTGDDLGAAVPFDIAAVVGGPGSETFEAALPPPSSGSRAVDRGARDPLAALVATEPARPAAAQPFVTADGRVDLTVGWDDLDRTLAEATPSGEVRGFDALIAEVGAAGIAPFDPLGDNAEWEAFTDDDDFGKWDEESVAVTDVPASGTPAMSEPARADEAGLPTTATGDDLVWPDDLMAVGSPAVAPDGRTAVDEIWAETNDTPAAANAEMDAIQAATAGWDAIEEELAAAVPPLGGTIGVDGVESIDDEGLVPFDFAFPAQAVDPLANPDSVGPPLAFDDLLMVTSRDATGPLVDIPSTGFGSDHGWDAADGDSAPVVHDADRWANDDADGSIAPAAPAANALPGIEPFAFEETPLPPMGDAIDFSDVEDVVPVAVGELDDFALFEDPTTAGGNEVPVEPGGHADDWAADLSPLANAEDGPAMSGAAIGVGVGAGETSTVPQPDGGEVAEWAADADAAAPAPPAPSAWPSFIGGTSELVAAEGESATIFASLRAEKAALVGQGTVHVDRALGENAAPAPALEGPPPVAEPTATATDAALLAGAVEPAVVVRQPQPALSPPAVAEIARWRERLRLGEADAAAVVAEVADRIATVGDVPAYTRVLAEAYLTLGRPDLAAVRLRVATVQRLARA